MACLYNHTSGRWECSEKFPASISTSVEDVKPSRRKTFAATSKSSGLSCERRPAAAQRSTICATAKTGVRAFVRSSSAAAPLNSASNKSVFLAPAKAKDSAKSACCRPCRTGSPPFSSCAVSLASASPASPLTSCEAASTSVAFIEASSAERARARNSRPSAHAAISAKLALRCVAMLKVAVPFAWSCTKRPSASTKCVRIASAITKLCCSRALSRTRISNRIMSSLALEAKVTSASGKNVAFDGPAPPSLWLLASASRRRSRFAEANSLCTPVALRAAGVLRKFRALRGHRDSDVLDRLASQAGGEHVAGQDAQAAAAKRRAERGNRGSGAGANAKRHATQDSRRPRSRMARRSG
mmetsp:Transcript_41606/g.114690  ORF Transcript_41606/g.114690 Transcript_41606/m.114690 type:complete len:356 (-) Transcript_41606:40-1107(-)